MELAELQEELVTEIAGVLETQVYSLEIERALKKPGDLTAWEAIARAWFAYRKWDEAARAEFLDEARRAVAIAPDYAPGHALLANGLANAYLVEPDDPDEVQRIRAIAERAIALAPDDPSVLASVGIALCFTGYPEEGVRCTGRAVHKAPGSGLIHWQHGIVCLNLNRLEEALAHLNTAERLAPGSLMWIVKTWQSGAYREQERLAEAAVARDLSISLNPTHAFDQVYKALLCVLDGRDAEARSAIETARRMGMDFVLAERLWRRIHPNSPTLEADLAVVRALYTAAEGAA